MVAAGSDNSAPAKVIWLADYRGRGSWLGDPPPPPRPAVRKTKDDTLLAEAVVADGADRCGIAAWPQCVD
jgi:hypothetical protein